MKIIFTTLLLAALALQVCNSKPYPMWQGLSQIASKLDDDIFGPYGGQIDDYQTAKASYVAGNLKAVTIFVQNNVLKVYDGAGPNGQLKAQLSLDRGRVTDKLAYCPNVPAGATTYVFNLGALIGSELDRDNPCTLFESETDDFKPLPPRRVVGADGLGNHVGQKLFGEETYTFWITFDQRNYILPNSPTYDWEAQIVCVVPEQSKD